MSSVALHKHEFAYGLCFVPSHVKTWVDVRWYFGLTSIFAFANRIMQDRCNCWLLATGGWTLHISCTRIFIATKLFGTTWAMIGTSMPSVLSTLGRLLCNKQGLTSFSVSSSKTGAMMGSEVEVRQHHSQPVVRESLAWPIGAPRQNKKCHGCMCQKCKSQTCRLLNMLRQCKREMVSGTNAYKWSVALRLSVSA